MLRHWSSTNPEKPAFIFRSSHPANNRFALTRGNLFALAARYAAVLRRRGVRQGDVVCNTLPNSPERLVTDMGIMLAGAVAMSGMMFLADGEDLVGIIGRSKCVAVVMDRGLAVNALTVLQSRLRVSGERDEVVCPEAPLLKILLHVDCSADKNGGKPFLEVLNKEQETYVAEVRPSDTAFIFTTSGSTGFSKMVPRSHASFLAVGESFYCLSALRPDDVHYNDRSLGRISGAPTIYVKKGVTRVLLDESLALTDNLHLMWHSIKSERCTTGLTIPLLLDTTLGRPELWEDLTSRLRVLVKLVDGDLQEIQEVGQAGEVLCRGPSVFQGYLGLREKDQGHEDVFTEDGWFRSGDVAYVNTKGELHVVCRNVVVVPVPDPVVHQELCACVVPQPGAKVTADEVREFCKRLFLTPDTSDVTQVPRYYVFFGSFPTTPTGKTDRKTILTMALERLGLYHSLPTGHHLYFPVVTTS
nr:hypothetical protein BaRGS_017148 [Batillaria attramentaria]